MKTILVVDADATLASLIAIRFSAAGYAAHTALTGEAAVELLPQLRPDLIIADAALSVGDGRDVGRLLQADPAYEPIPILMLSALVDGFAEVNGTFRAFLRTS